VPPDREPASLRALLEGILDYAGLFPPAALSLEAAVAEYARHREEPAAWMLSHFICPAGRVADFAAEAGPRAGSKPWTLSLLGRGGATEQECLDAAAEDLDRADAALSGTATVRALELKIPGYLMEDSRDAGRFVSGLDDVILPRAGGGLPVFLEIPWDPEHLGRLPALFSRLASAARERASVRLGVKVRTGGLEASAFPPPDELAAFLEAALGAGLPFKATAGLHHPLRHYAATPGARRHGFLNVFLGAALRSTGAIPEASLPDVLRDEDTASFAFHDDAAAWRGHRVPTPAIAEARRRFAVSFGSCSFAEPRDELRGLGLLP